MIVPPHRTASIFVRVALALATAASLPLVALAQWIPNGVALCGSCDPAYTKAVSDGAGGVYANWQSNSDYTRSFAQHLAGDGSRVSGWPAAGLRIDHGDGTQTRPGYLVSDGAGGALMSMDSDPGGFTVYLRRVLPDGSFPPLWPVGGARAVAGPANHSGSVAETVLDGQGGTLMGFEYDSSGTLIRAQHVGADGLPLPGWPLNGIGLAPMATGFQLFPATATDDSGGAYVFWEDYRPNGAVANGDIYAQRIRGDGSIAPGWPVTGLPICTAPTQQTWYHGEPAVSDGVGGAYTAWTDFRNRTAPPNQFVQGDIYLAHVRRDGTFPSGWPVNGLGVAVDPGVYEAKQLDDLIGDGLGGAFVAWEGGPGGVRVQRVLANGTVAPGWTPNSGARMSTFSDYFDEAVMCTDGVGGVYVAATAENVGVVYIQHLTATGQIAAGWSATGTPLVTGADDAFHPSICSDGRGGAIVVWADARPTGFSCRAALFPGDGATPVLMSLVSALALSDRIDLSWSVELAPGSHVTLERSTNADSWSELATLSPDGDGRVAYSDRAVAASARYGYRLAWGAAGAEQRGGETWVQMPAAQLALAGLRPNPATGADLKVAFTLTSADPASLELMDIAGRRVVAREVGALGAGPHVEPLAANQRVAPGMYWLRLSQGKRSLVAKAVVVR